MMKLISIRYSVVAKWPDCSIDSCSEHRVVDSMLRNPRESGECCSNERWLGCSVHGIWGVKYPSPVMTCTGVTSVTGACFMNASVTPSRIPLRCLSVKLHASTTKFMRIFSYTHLQLCKTRRSSHRSRTSTKTRIIRTWISRSSFSSLSLLWTYELDSGWSKLQVGFKA